jgi:hypothetical protein
MMLSIYMYWFSVNGHVFQDPVVHKSVKFYWWLIFKLGYIQ